MFSYLYASLFITDKIVVRASPSGIEVGVGVGVVSEKLYWTNHNPLTGVSQLIGSDLNGLNPVVMVAQLISLQQFVQLTIAVTTLVQAVSDLAGYKYG